MKNLVILSILISILSSCGKDENKCGCDGEVIDEISEGNYSYGILKRSTVEPLNEYFIQMTTNINGTTTIYSICNEDEFDIEKVYSEFNFNGMYDESKSKVSFNGVIKEHCKSSSSDEYKYYDIVLASIRLENQYKTLP